jgi:thioredoxin reductase (NADPH)
MADYTTKCLIIGSGPAGCTAAIYAARANLDPIMLCGPLSGGQLVTTTDVENFPGFIKIQGPAMMDIMHKHAAEYGTKIIEDIIESVDFSKRPFICKSADKTYIAQTVIICTGAQAKWLGIESEDRFKGFGVSACATCDGFFFKNKIVAVVGGGNTALTEAIYLTNHANKVYIIHRRDTFRGEKILIDKVLANPKIEIIWDTFVSEVIGQEDEIGRFVTGLEIKNNKMQTTKQIPVDGLFVAIGHKPNTDIFKGQLEMDNEGYILTKAGTPITSVQGIFAAGDVQDKIYKQAVTSAGSGCAAALEAESFLH